MRAPVPTRFPGVPARIAAEPLVRLLLVNLGIGVVVSAILLGGLLGLNPHRLRDLILADHSPGTALILLLFGFVVTFGSAAMGTAIMAIGRRDSSPSGGRTMPAEPVPVRAAAARRAERG
jgi:hypothetical protein